MLNKTHPLYGASIKIDRARDQILALAKEIKEYLSTGISAFRCHDPDFAKEAKLPGAPPDFSLGDGIALMAVKFEKEIPAMWSAAIGEIIHNLRSPLDYFVWELYILENGKEPDKSHHQFPLCLTENDFRSAKSSIEGLSPAAQAAIRSVQPFATGQGKGSPLWTLSKLSNPDKHREIHIAAAGAFDQSSKMVVGDGGGDPIIFTPKPPLKDGDPLFGRFIPHGEEPVNIRAGRVPLDGTARFEIVFLQPETGEWLAAVPALGTMRNHVLEFGQRIARDFFRRV